MRLQVCEVILTWVCECRASQCHGAVLVGGIHLRRLHGVWHQFVDVGHLQLLEHPADHSTLVENLRELLGHLHHSLHLGDALGLAEDVRIGHRHHVAVALEVFALDRQLGNDVTLALLVQVPAVDAGQYLEHPALAVMQAGVDAGEHCGTLLDQSLSRAHRRARLDVSDLFFCGGHYPLGGVRQPAQEAEKHLAGGIERHGHGDLADVVHTRGRFDLGDLRHVDVLRLAGDLGTLEFDHGGRVVDVRGVQQGT